jgi:hypothetical protein
LQAIPQKCLNFGEISTLSKENPLKMSEFLKNYDFFNEISPSYTLISKNDLVLPAYLKIRTSLNEILLVLPEFL